MSALEYAGSRVQFGRPIASFQLTQRKLVEVLIELDKGMLLALHLGRMKDRGRLAPQQVSVGKLNNVRAALDIAREARTVLGANGITLDYPVIRHMNNLESVLRPSGRPSRDMRLTAESDCRSGSMVGAARAMKEKPSKI
jgi:glutaryl-CoA dehydrogenase